jgi:hypothetical protein
MNHEASSDRVNNAQQRLDPTETATPLVATRRTTLRLAGGGALASLGIAGFGGRVMAQDASPVPGPTSKVGLYYVSRTRTVKSESSFEEMNAAISEGLAPQLQAIPGFVEYNVVQNDETRERTGVSIFTDKTGTDESTRVVGEYLQGFADFYEDVEPIIQEGSIVFAAS